jgi:uncharacterized membrane protein
VTGYEQSNFGYEPDGERQARPVRGAAYVGSDQGDLLTEPPEQDLRVERGEAELAELEPRERLLIQVVEQRLTTRIEHIFQHQIEPYGGLPSTDELDRLDNRFPELQIPKRLLGRIETEQRHRHEVELQMISIDRFDAESRRVDSAGDRSLQRFSILIAFGAFVLLLGVGVSAMVLAYTAIALVVLGTSLVGVVSSFVVANRRPSPSRAAEQGSHEHEDSSRSLSERSQ